MPNTNHTAHITTENTTNKNWDFGPLATLSMSSGGAIGMLGGGITAWTIGGAAVGVATTGGVGLVVGAAVGGIVTLSIWLSQKPNPPNYTMVQIDQLNADDDKLSALEQQPLQAAHAVLLHAQEHINTTIRQTNAQNLRTDSVVMALADVIENVDDTTTRLSQVIPRVHQATTLSMNTMQTMETELSQLRIQIVCVTTALQQTQRALADKEALLSETNLLLSTTQDALAKTTWAAQHQLTELVAQQRHLNDVLSAAKPETLLRSEMDDLKRQLGALSSKNERLNQTITTLSHHIMAVIHDNQLLRKQNGMLKQKRSFFLPPPQKQALPSQDELEPLPLRPRSKTQ